VGALGVSIWAFARSPVTAGDVALGVCVYLPVLAIVYRLAAERLVADPAADGISLHSLFRIRKVAWWDVDRFEVTDWSLIVAPAQSVTCVVKSGERIRVRGAGTWTRGEFVEVSATSRKTVSLIAQELNVRFHQHEHGLPIDQLPQLD
jgi:hypothetical protein